MPMPALNMVQSMLDTGELSGSQIGKLQFSAGSKIFEQGDVGDCAYMVDRGYVEVSYRAKDEKNVLAMLGPGEIFGEIALLDGRSRSATATALHESTVIVISRQQLFDAVHGASPLARLVLTASINRLRATQSVNVPMDQEPNLTRHEESRIAAQYDVLRLDAAKQLRLRLELDNAIAKQQFALVYQPIITLTDGRTAGFEALIRWPRPGQQTVFPNEFIPLAEQSGLIIPLGLWVLEQALQALSAIDRRPGTRRNAGADVFMSLNVSPRQLECESTVEQLARTIERADIDPTRVKLELTEQALLSDPRMATLSLARLKATGASIAIDDFGTGYSSLNYLHRFPFDTLKIDRSFVTKLSDDANGQRVVAAIIGLAHELGLNVVAEGIEEKAELYWLQAHACLYGQGYLMAKPSSLIAAVAHLDRNFEW